MKYASNKSNISDKMTTGEARKLEKIANESMEYARKAVAKSNELYTLLSLMEAREGKVRRFISARTLFKRLKI